MLDRKDLPAELQLVQQWAVLLDPPSDPDSMPPGNTEAAPPSQLGDGGVVDDASGTDETEE